MINTKKSIGHHYNNYDIPGSGDNETIRLHDVTVWYRTTEVVQAMIHYGWAKQGEVVTDKQVADAMESFGADAVVTPHGYTVNGRYFRFSA
jgi:poly-gamma-glutamate capsule biosynthesis protein CapA/YwtB (metallophosphatase superfamily)